MLLLTGREALTLAATSDVVQRCNSVHCDDRSLPCQAVSVFAESTLLWHVQHGLMHILSAHDALGVGNRHTLASMRTSIKHNIGVQYVLLRPLNLGYSYFDATCELTAASGCKHVCCVSATAPGDACRGGTVSCCHLCQVVFVDVCRLWACMDRGAHHRQS